MTIIDLNGCSIEVTNLKEAIRITDEYRHYRHDDNSFSDFDKRQNAYWSDMHGKLTAIRVQLETTLKPDEDEA